MKAITITAICIYFPAALAFIIGLCKAASKPVPNGSISQK